MNKVDTMYLNTYAKGAMSLLAAVVLTGCGGGGTSSEDATVNEAKSLKAITGALKITSEQEITVNENTAAVTAVTSTGGVAPITYTISRGDDAALFNIDAQSGILTFVDAPDYEAPADKDGNNAYDVTVTAIDDTGRKSSKALTVAVMDVDETPVVEETLFVEEIVVVEEPAVEEVVIIEEPAVEEQATEEPIAEEPVVVEEPVIIDEPAVEEPTVEEPVVIEEPIIEEPVTEEPVVEEPVIEEPVVEEPVVIEEPIAEEPVVVEEPVIEESAPVCVEGPATHSGQVTDSVSALGMAGVEVSIGGCETTTDAEGYYTLSNIAATERAVVNFDHDGYFKSSVLIQVDHYSEGTTNVSLNYLEHTIDAYDNQWSYDSQSEISGAHVDVPAGSLSDAAGNAYTGTVNAGLEYFDIVTDADKKLFPGAFEGQNVNGETVLFSSYGLVSLSLSDINGNALNLAEGATATLTFDAVASLPEQNIIPLWYYDYTQGLWIEEGYAELQADGTYKGEVSHLGTWSVNMPLETAPGTYRGRIVYSDGISVKDARVAAIGPNWVRSDLSTDADGNFEIEVLPDDNFKLVAYNYKWKYEAAYSGTIAAVASGDIVE